MTWCCDMNYVHSEDVQAETMSTNVFNMLLAVHMCCIIFILMASISDCILYINVRFLGSVEVNGFKGNEIICDAMKEVKHKSL